MPMHVSESKDGKIIEIDVTEKLTDEDYQQFIPEFEREASGHNKLRLLLEMSEFHGWEAKAAWDDLKLGMKHPGKVERIAMVGEKKWQQWMAGFSKLFTAAEVRFFDRTEDPAARAWLAEGLV